MNRKSRKSRKIRKISLVLGIAVAAFTVGVPTALAEGRMVGTQEPSGVAFFKANEMSTLSQQNVSPISTNVDSSPYQLYAKFGTTAVQSQEMKALQARSEALNRQYGLGAYATTAGSSTYQESGQRAVPQPTSPGNSPITTSDDFEWPPVGIGLLIGLVLILGIGLAVRTNRMRPAH
jgi:hypothetical protein